MGTITDREPVGWADVASKTDLRLLAAEIIRDVNQQLGKMAARIAEVEVKMAELRGDVTEQIGQLREEMQKMRGDLIRSNHRTTLWIVIAVSTMPQVVAEFFRSSDRTVSGQGARSSRPGSRPTRSGRRQASGSG